MKLYLTATVIIPFIGACATAPESQPGSCRQPPSVAIPKGHAPEWVKKMPDRMAEVLVERHLCKDGPAWGLARRDPTGHIYGDLAYEEVGSSNYYNIVQSYNLWDKVPPLTEDEKKKALQFWQSWQDPETGLFKDPRNPDRLVSEKYVVGLIRIFGGEPLYPQPQSAQMLAGKDSGTIDTRNFLERAKHDPDWAVGGWGAGSHTGYIARELFYTINDGHPELIPDLEKGLEYILSHQDPQSGLWGPPSARLDQRLGGALKVIGRLFDIGLNVPYTRQLADSLIEHERNGDWYRVGQSFCVPHNVIWLVAFCMETSDYRRDDLRGVLESKIKEYQEWIQPDGTMLLYRGDPSSACVESVHLVAISYLAGYLGWEDSPFKTRIDMEAMRKPWDSYRYRAFVQKDGSVKVVDTGKK